MKDNFLNVYYKEEDIQRYGISITINKIGDHSKHCHNFYEFEYLLDGTTECTIDKKSCTVEKNDLIFVNPKNIHSYKKIQGQATSVTIHFTDEILPRAFKLSDIGGCVLKNVPHIAPFFQTAYNEYIKYDSYSFYGITNAIQKIVIEFLRLCGKEKNMSKDTVEHIESYIFIHFRENISLKDISAYFGYSPAYFSRFFKSHTGENFSAYVMNCRLNYAYSLLLLTDMSVSDICYASGFNSERTFLRAFKNKYNYTPSQIKRSKYVT